MEALVARPEPPADTREREAPQCGAGEGENRVARKPHAEDAGGNRHEGPHDRGDPADEHCPVLVLVEPAFRAIEPRRIHVEHAAVALEEGAPTVEPDGPASDGTQEVADRPGEGDCEI